MTQTLTEAADKLETCTCGRCGGSGHYSYCQSYGTTCFKCAGRKLVYTKRGQAAADYLEQLRSKPAGELKVGDVIKAGMITVGGSPYDAWATIESIKPQDTSGWSSLRDGVMQPVVGEFLEIQTNKVTLCGWPKDKMVRVAMSAEQKRETFKQALAYQATLTKSGTPRK